MTNLQATVRRHLTPILLLLLAGGYLVILGELFLYRHWEGTQLIGFAATVIGLVAVLLGLFAQRGLRLGLAILLAVISLSGLIGTYQHFESGAEEGAAAQPVLTQAGAGANLTIAYRPGAERLPTQEDEDEEGERSEGGEAGEGGEETPPPLAPLSLAGLSLMGAAILLAKQDTQS